ncbi:Zinc finger CCCH domain-containing protein 42 [Striga hermonthica]|uniref:Zinc finger CCCH domain-containing protein 42 n=1 Tax=Striga hermonthica TaxID=68872 RepID=A0A9N7MSN8_STRHE|nr:Zinc finger CCCH domain-containing protein 42 [Striga hermonthica]
MNPLTLVKRIQNINKKEASLGISEEASWHAKYKDSAYVYVGGIPFDLTEGDLLAVFAQYGEIVDVNLIRDKGTGKSKGFCFIAYEDQRSTNLAVDNLNGAQILGRIIRVDHVSKYKKLEEEDEETKQRKREERGVCRAFQKGECNRGDSCRFSHDQQRAADTGWGAEEDRHSRWVQDKFEGRTGHSHHTSGSAPPEARTISDKHFRPKATETDRHRDSKRSHTNYAERKDSMEERDYRNDKRSRKYESESYHGGDKYGRDSSSRSGRDSRNHRARARDGHE